MSRLISDILGAPEPHFSHTIQHWEQQSNRPGHDVRLLSDITQRQAQALKHLNLDVHDTTPKELFYALRHRSQLTHDKLQNKAGILDADSPADLVEKIIKYVDSLDVPREVWALKNSAVKQLLLKQPPKKLMKALGLRSIESVLKRNSAHEMLALASQLESAEWCQKIRNHYKKYTPSDFQTMQNCIYIADESKVSKIVKAGYVRSKIVLSNYESGTILLMTPKKRFPLDSLAITISILQAIYDLRVYSSYFRHIGVTPEFGNQLQNVLQKGLPGKVDKGKIGWRILQKHFNTNPRSFATLEQPHLQHEDIIIIDPITLLPDADVWHAIQYVFMHSTQRPVSLHLMDVVVNASNNVPYEQSVNTSMQAKLWEELGVRYLQSAPIEQVMIAEIDN